MATYGSFFVGDLVEHPAAPGSIWKVIDILAKQCLDGSYLQFSNGDYEWEAKLSEIDEGYELVWVYLQDNNHQLFLIRADEVFSSPLEALAKKLD